MKKFLHLSVFNICLAVTILFIFLTLVVNETPRLLPFLSSINLKAMVDTKFRLRGPRTLANDIIIVKIDDKSIEELGRWPWNRSILAQGLSQLAKAKPKVIAFDMVFSEPDPSAHTAVFSKLQRTYRILKEKDEFYQVLNSEARKANTDRYLSNEIKRINKKIPLILGYFFYFSKERVSVLKTDWQKEFKQIFDSKITAKISTVRYPPEDIPTALGAKSSIAVYAKATKHHAFFDVEADLDGAIRKTHLIGKYKNTLFPSFGLKTAALALKKEIVVQFDAYGINNIFLGEQIPKVNTRGQMWLNYAGPANSFPSISFYDIFKGKYDKSLLKDKIVLIGVSAKAVGDIRVSAVDNNHAGVEINATAVENLVHKTYLSRPSNAKGLELLFIFLMGLLLSLIYKRLHARASALITVVLGCTYFIADYQFLFLNGILANSFMPALHLLFTFGSVTAFKYFVEEKRSREIKEAFQHYVSPAVVKEILKDPSQLALGGEKRRLTVLFSDIRSFTTISETVNDPEKLTHLLNLYLTEMTDIVYKQSGMLDKYVGDELMAVFGAPLKRENHALDACQSAIEMIQKLSEVRKKWALEGVDHLDIGIGIHTGDMIVGNMGSTKIFDYTVIGDSVNLGARLEGTNKQYGTHIIISEDVHSQLNSSLLTRELDFIRVRGKNKPVQIFELLAFAPKADEDLLGIFAKGLEHYRNKQWDQGIQIFDQLTKRFPNDGPSKTFLKRCKLYKDNPPAKDWDGVFVMQTK